MQYILSWGFWLYLHNTSALHSACIRGFHPASQAFGLHSLFFVTEGLYLLSKCPFLLSYQLRNGNACTHDKCKLTRVFWGNWKGLEEKRGWLDAHQLVRDQNFSFCPWWVHSCKSVLYALSVWWFWALSVHLLQMDIFINGLLHLGFFFFFFLDFLHV